MKLHLLSFCAILSVAAPSGIYADPDPAVAALEASYQELMETVEQPLADLRAKYLESIETWKLQSQQRGDLQAVIAAQQEIDTVDLASERNLANWPELQRLRNIYETSLARLVNDLNAERIKLQRSYRDRLQQEVERLTREGKLEEALRVSAMVREVNEAIDRGTAKSVSITTPTSFQCSAGNRIRPNFVFTNPVRAASSPSATRAKSLPGRPIPSRSTFISTALM